ncbi:MAG: hypothetical protein GXP26_00900 [Planctomycetes bacterium]|nr:hypothetical protein [Planctomycetota bacterium]
MIAIGKKFSILISAMAVVVLCVSTVDAQQASQGFGARRAGELTSRNNISWFSADTIRSQARQVFRDRFAPVAPPIRASASRPAPKPFSTISRGPTVSPYLALNNPLSQASDYYNIVRPNREQRNLNQQQQRVNQQLLRQNIANQSRLNQMAVEGPYNPKGSELLAPTGHGAGYQQLGNYLNLGGYFPPPSPPKGQ